ncbi:MAG: GNAT family N-acetyltransferase [Spirochaetaceae bacterium]|nr:MAG: GNAT family N-acetyltransferase [Spirochaetaceae bacterium]
MIEIREARPEDLDAIVSLLGELKDVTLSSAPIAPAAVRKTYQRMLRFPEVYRNCVAVENSRVVGLISMVLYKTLLHAGGTALINELVVSESARRRGIGRKLVEAAIAVARVRGMEEIEVGTETGNHVARRFYKSMGFGQEYLLFGREFERPRSF